MKQLILTLALITLTSTPVWAAHKIDIKVNGMVCDFCAQAVWKVFEDYDAVKKVDVNLDTGTVSVTLKDGQTLSDEALNQAIHYAGYDLVEITHHD